MMIIHYSFLPLARDKRALLLHPSSAVPLHAAISSRRHSTHGMSRKAKAQQMTPQCGHEARPSNLDLAGSLNSPQITKYSQSLSMGHPSPKKQPPMFWKAFGFALKQKFALSGSLHDDRRALFIAEPGQAGIPDGRPYPQEVTNFELFIKADTMQRLNYPTFSLGGDSYFEFLTSYLLNAGIDQVNDSKVAEARADFEQAKQYKDECWADACNRFALVEAQSGETTGASDSGALIRFLDSDQLYQKAWKAEEDAARAFYRSRSPKMAELSKKVDMLRLADKRLELQKGNNMAVAAVSEDWVTRLLQDPNSKEVNLLDPALIYHRPFYSLPNYETDVTQWTRASESGYRDGPYTIPLAGIWRRKWADLGHPLLDQARPVERFSSQQKEMLAALTVNLTYLQKPSVFQVNTGQWGVNRFRDYHLPPDVPEELNALQCRTTKMIFAWGFEVEVIIPSLDSVMLKESGRSGVPVTELSLRNLALSAIDLPLKQSAKEKNKLVFRVEAQPVPLLVGALADIV